MFFVLRNSGVRRSAMVVSMLALCSCSALTQLFEPAPKPVVEQPEPQKKVYDAPAFIYSLASAKLALENGEQVKDIASDVKVLESYSTVKRKKSATLPLVVMDYKVGSSDKLQKLVVYTGSEGSDTASLGKLVKRMDGYKTIPQEITVLSVPVKTTPMKFAKKDSAQALALVKEEQDTLLAHGSKLAAIDEAQIQISLLRFFIDHKKKDAAYLSADAAKRLLATAVQKPDDAQDANELSGDLDKLEGELRKNLPY